MPRSKVGLSTPQEGSGIRVIARAADILASLGQHPEGMSLGELALTLDIPRSSVQRIVGALEEANLIIAASTERGFRLGPALTQLAECVRPCDIAEVVRPLMRQLASETTETVSLSVLAHGKAVVLDQVTGQHKLLAVSTVGRSMPLHATANGKALLAALPRKELNLLRRRISLDPLTRRTTTSWDKLDLELELIRETGLAFDHQEYMVGICSVATLVRSPLGEIGSISFPVPTARYKDAEPELIQALLQCRHSTQRHVWLQPPSPAALQAGMPKWMVSSAASRKARE